MNSIYYRDNKNVFEVKWRDKCVIVQQVYCVSLICPTWAGKQRASAMSEDSTSHFNQCLSWQEPLMLSETRCDCFRHEDITSIPVRRFQFSWIILKNYSEVHREPSYQIWRWPNLGRPSWKMTVYGNESGFRPPLCTYRLNWARRTSWGWWDDWDDTVLQTQDSKFEPWRSEAEHATSRSRRLPTILTFTRGWGRNNFVSFKSPRPGTEPRTLARKAAVLTTTLGPPPDRLWIGKN